MDVLQLPPPQPPMTTRVISNRLVPGKSETVIWIVSGDNPVIEAKIVRMFVIPDGGGVDVYSVTPKGEGVRHHIPESQIRIAEELMPVKMLIEEIEDAENSDDNNDDPEAPEEEVAQDPNGQT